MKLLKQLIAVLSLAELGDFVSTLKSLDHTKKAVEDSL